MGMWGELRATVRWVTCTSVLLTSGTILTSHYCHIFRVPYQVDTSAVSHAEKILPGRGESPSHLWRGSWVISSSASNWRWTSAKKANVRHIAAAKMSQVPTEACEISGLAVFPYYCFNYTYLMSMYQLMMRSYMKQMKQQNISCLDAVVFLLKCPLK